VDTFAVVVEDVEALVLVSVEAIDNIRTPSYIADNAKHIATPKKKVENTMMSAVDAEEYRGCRALYTGMGRPKNSNEPMRCNKMFTVSQILETRTEHRRHGLTCFVVDAEDTVQRLVI